MERPLIRNDESLPLATNMNIGVHPNWVANGTFVTICDNFLVGRNGVERLHKLSREIVEL